MPEKSKFLNRFTTIPFAIDLLARKQLTLLNPLSWEDYNDRVTMELYQKNKNAKGIYALCLTDNRETIHHWNAFASGTNGCCIEFDYEKLIKCFCNITGLEHGKTQYVKINNLNNLKVDTDKLPYLKREAFSPENEYRVIILSDQAQNSTLDIPIDLSCIRRITITSKLPKSIFESLKEVLQTISSDFKGKISHSTLLNNSQWIKHFIKYEQ